RDALTNEGGEFLIDPVAPGTYLLSAAAGNIASEEIRVEVRDGEAPPHVTLVLKPLLSDGTPRDRRGDGSEQPDDSRRPGVLKAGANLLNERIETGRIPVVTPGPPPHPDPGPLLPLA